MQESKISIERDNVSTIDYNMDYKIINGLYTTTDNKKVSENIKNFNIEIEQISNGVAQKLSKRNQVVIVTILIDELNKFQYLVRKDMNLDELEKTNEMPSGIKLLIKDAFDLTKVVALKDLLK